MQERLRWVTMLYVEKWKQFFDFWWNMFLRFEPLYTFYVEKMNKYYKFSDFSARRAEKTTAVYLIWFPTASISRAYVSLGCILVCLFFFFLMQVYYCYLWKDLFLQYPRNSIIAPIAPRPSVDRKWHILAQRCCFTHIQCSVFFEGQYWLKQLLPNAELERTSACTWDFNTMCFPLP